MATKKPSRNVIDYDPLAWLNEVDDEDAGSANQSDPDSRPASPADTGHAAVSSDRHSGPATEEPAAYGFFDDDEPAEAQPDESALLSEPAESQAAAANGSSPLDTATPQPADDEENAAYGFFTEHPAETATIDADSGSIDLGTELTIRSVATCKGLIEEKLANGFDVRLSAANLQKIDTAGLQLLYSLKMTLNKTGQTIHWESGHSLINESAALIGLPALCDSDDDPGYGFLRMRHRLRTIVNRQSRVTDFSRETGI